MGQAEKPYPVAELLAAVRSEILAERRGDGGDGQKVPLSGGRLVSTVGDRFEYLFVCRKWHDSLDGMPVLVRASRASGPWATAEASRMPDGTVRLVTRENLGQSVRNAQIRKDDSAGLAVVAERLESAGQPDSGIRTQSAGWMVGQGTPVTGRDADAGRWVANWRALKLNSRQRLAVEQALASQILFLWGPPGTRRPTSSVTSWRETSGKDSTSSSSPRRRSPSTRLWSGSATSSPPRKASRRGWCSVPGTSKFRPCGSVTESSSTRHRSPLGSPPSWTRR